MNSTNKYGLEYAGPKKRGWKKRLGCWLWAFVWMLALWLVMWGVFAVAQRVMPRSARNEETRMANEEFVLRHSGFDIPAQRAGFGVPEWVAYGIVGTLVLGLLGRLAWGAIMEGKEADTLAMPPEHDPMAWDEELDAPWMRSLKAFFAGRGVRLTNEQCVIIRAKCVPPGATSLPFLSVYLQRELKLRLLMTTLMEIQAICMGPLQPGRVG